MEQSTATLEKPAILSFSREPIAIITNVAFLVAAVFIAFRGSAGATALIAALTLLCIGSAAFHAYGSKTGGLPHYADVGSLYVVAGATVFHAWHADLWILIVAMVVVGILTLLIGKIGATLPVIAAAILIGLGISMYAGWQAAILPLGLGIVAFVVRYLSDKFGEKGNHTMDDLLHGVWHILIAAAVYTAWLASL